MAITMTPSAVARIEQLLTAAPKTPWLRLAIKGGGCSGMSYVLDFVEAAGEKDKRFSFSDHVNVCVDRKSYLYVNGIEIDWQSDLITQSFVFNNPQATKTCSCGESFAV